MPWRNAPLRQDHHDVVRRVLLHAAAADDGLLMLLKSRAEKEKVPAEGTEELVVGGFTGE